MTETKSLKKKLLAFFLIIAVTITMIPMGLISSTESADAATTYSFTSKSTSISVKGSDGKTYKAGTTKFTISSLGVSGLCTQNKVEQASSGKATVSLIANTDKRAKLAYYYGYQKGYLNTANANRIKLARAFSYLTDSSRTCWPYSKSDIRAFINAMPSVTVPDGFKVYYCNPSGGSQDFIAWKMLPNGKATLVKTSTDSKSVANGMEYNFTGIKYTVYNASGKSVGTLTCNASGTTNTLSLAPGNYTAKETATNDWYEMNSKVYSFTVKSSTTTTIKASDAPKTGQINIQKHVTDNSYNDTLEFNFKLTNTANSSIVYNVTTDKKTGKASVDVLQGTYRIEEVLTDEQKDQNFVDETGPQTETIEIGETYTFERYNAKPRKGTLSVAKTVNDGGPVSGFLFKVTGKLFNYGTITEKKIIDTAAPKLTTDHTGYDLGEWRVDAADVAALNKSAKNWENGIKKVTLTNKLTYNVSQAKTPEEIIPKLTEEQPHPDTGEIEVNTLVKDGNTVYKAVEKSSFDIAYVMVEDPDVPGTQIEKDPAEIDQDKTLENIKALLKSDKFETVDTSDINLAFDVPVNLKDVEYVYDEASPDDAAFERDLDKQVKDLEKDTASADPRGTYPVEFNKFSWYGAATIYKEFKDGALTEQAYSEIETTAKGSTEPIKQGISAGIFTVEEVMTDEQSERYNQPQKQTKTIEDENAVFTFNFSNTVRTDVEVEITKVDANTGETVEGATLQVIDPNTGEVVKEWVSTLQPHVVELTYNKEYLLKESINPRTYDLNTQEVKFVAGKDKVVELENTPIKISGQIDKRQTLAGSGDTFSYSIDYRSTSSTWADEFNMKDTIDCATKGYARLTSIVTPVSFEDYDGKMNVWYKTNKTPSNFSDDAVKYNACASNPINPWNPDNKRVEDYTGWKLWKKDVSTLKTELLQVSDLGLSNGEYITGVAFEHGRVEKGFATRTSGWNREDLKSTDDNLPSIAPHADKFNLNSAAGITKGEGILNYAPAVFNMTVINKDVAPAVKEYWNSAEISIYRNLDQHPDLEDHDNDKVVQTYSIGYISIDDRDKLVGKIVSTGDDMNIIIPCALILLCIFTLIALIRKTY